MRSIEVVAAIIMDGEKIFATQRGYGEWKGWWEFPGGKIDVGESPEEALIREIREELATEIAIDSFLTTTEHDYPSFHLTMHCFICHVLNGQLTLLEHEAARWLAPRQLDEIKWLPADVTVIPMLRQYLKGK
ncbi:MAG: (deoxy)nucleoside triphosphate pyrophosphohydrolase [Muribaculaceae bacterium]